jgi:hypothetical protein
MKTLPSESVSPVANTLRDNECIGNAIAALSPHPCSIARSTSQRISVSRGNVPHEK